MKVSLIAIGHFIIHLPVALCMFSFRAAAIVALVGGVADILSTAPAIGIDGVQEANPVAVAMFNVFGPLAGMVILKTVALLMIVGLAGAAMRMMDNSSETERGRRVSRAYIKHLVMFSGVIQLAAAASNALLILQVGL